MAPFNTHYKAATVYMPNPASQDAFDAKLNQTVFAVAFGLAALVFLGAAAWVSYWAVGRCRAQRRASTGVQKTGPRALLLPGQVAARDSLKGEEGLDDEPEENIGEGEKERRSFWFKKMRVGRRTAKDDDAAKYANRRSLVQPPPRAHLNPRLSLAADFPGLFAFDASYSPPLSDLSDSSGSEDSDSIPRIKIEDVDHGSMSNDALSIGVSQSQAGSDMSLDEKQDDERLSVPPMSWNAPRDSDAVDDDVEKNDDHVAGTSCQLPQHAQNPLQRTASRSGNEGELKPRMKTALANLHNITRFRPRLSRQMLSKTRPVTGLSSR
ncbi:hypothetical protein EIP86_008461 [Pleurotus ostreatoroseus]|nr:hypothetical protein EIP86_008461 [Pleurotus ostreatoroseus]